jgi:hypothetical protein
VTPYVDWRNRPDLGPSFLERYPLLVPLLLVFATLINWG